MKTLRFRASLLDERAIERLREEYMKKTGDSPIDQSSLIRLALARSVRLANEGKLFD